MHDTGDGKGGRRETRVPPVDPLFCCLRLCVRSQSSVAGPAELLRRVDVFALNPLRTAGQGLPSPLVDIGAAQLGTDVGSDNRCGAAQADGAAIVVRFPAIGWEERL